MQLDARRAVVQEAVELYVPVAETIRSPSKQRIAVSDCSNVKLLSHAGVVTFPPVTPSDANNSVSATVVVRLPVSSELTVLPASALVFVPSV
jgi:hypothetical protein